jgi:DNA-binding MarR family transcriptional regulator
MHDENRPPETALPALLRHACSTFAQAMRAAREASRIRWRSRQRNKRNRRACRNCAGFPIRQLVRELGVSKQAAGQLVDALVARGYLARMPDDDRRQIILTLTERGCAAAHTQSAAPAEIDGGLAGHVGTIDMAASRRALMALVDIGEKRRAAD